MGQLVTVIPIMAGTLEIIDQQQDTLSWLEEELCPGAVNTSTEEAECMALSAAAKEAICFSKIIKDFELMHMKTIWQQ